jgi:hypothetical protein
MQSAIHIETGGSDNVVGPIVGVGIAIDDHEVAALRGLLHIAISPNRLRDINYKSLYEILEVLDKVNGNRESQGQPRLMRGDLIIRKADWLDYYGKESSILGMIRSLKLRMRAEYGVNTKDISCTELDLGGPDIGSVTSLLAYIHSRAIRESYIINYDLHFPGLGLINHRGKLNKEHIRRLMKMRVRPDFYISHLLVELSKELDDVTTESNRYVSGLPSAEGNQT